LVVELQSDYRHLMISSTKSFMSGGLVSTNSPEDKCLYYNRSQVLGSRFRVAYFTKDGIQRIEGG